MSCDFSLKPDILISCKFISEKGKNLSHATLEMEALSSININNYFYFFVFNLHSSVPLYLYSRGAVDETSYFTTTCDNC